MILTSQFNGNQLCKTIRIYYVRCCYNIIIIKLELPKYRLSFIMMASIIIKIMSYIDGAVNTRRNIFKVKYNITNNKILSYARIIYLQIVNEEIWQV